MIQFDQDYVIRLIQQSQDKKGLLTHDQRSHRRGEEEHKINNKKVKEELLLRKTIVTIEFQEQKMILQTRGLHYLQSNIDLSPKN